MLKRYLVGTDFDKTLSKEDSGIHVAELIGVDISDFEKKLDDLRVKYFLQPGAELAYLLTHDEQFKGKVTKEILKKAGKRTQLKDTTKEFFEILKNPIKGVKRGEEYLFVPYVISAAPKEIVEACLEDIISPDNIVATEFTFDERGIVKGIKKTIAGYGKVIALDEILERENIPKNQVIYIGDGLSDIHLMLEVRTYKGFPISVSLSSYLSHVAHISVISAETVAVLIPILKNIVGYSEARIRDFLLEKGLAIRSLQEAEVYWPAIRKI